MLLAHPFFGSICFDEVHKSHHAFCVDLIKSKIYRPLLRTRPILCSRPWRAYSRHKKHVVGVAVATASTYIIGAASLAGMLTSTSTVSTACAVFCGV